MALYKSGFKTWFLIPLIIFIGMIVLLFFRLGKKTDIEPTQSLNKPVPSFSLPKITAQTDVAAEPVMVSNADLPNSPFLLNVWGSWCITCELEHPYLLDLAAKGMPIVGINYGDEPIEAIDYLNNNGDPFLFSASDVNGEMAVDLGLMGAPETFLVDSQGNIRQHLVGEINDEVWQNRLKPCWTALQSSDDKAIKQACQ